jgi:hypothetical protein
MPIALEQKAGHAGQRRREIRLQPGPDFRPERLGFICHEVGHQPFVPVLLMD